MKTMSNTLQIKYTSDGKKVVVIGNLNSQEKIVQEIFLINDVEVPSGENFVVTSLHDAPAVSWKEKRLAEIEANYVKYSAEYSERMDQLEKQYRSTCDRLGAFISYNIKAEKLINDESFSILLNFISGKIKYVLVGNYDFEIIEYEKFNIQYEKDLKLVTLFGTSGGDLRYRIDKYSDGSGGSNQEIYLFTNHKDALTKLKEIFSKCTYINSTMIASAKKYKIELPKEALKRYKAERLKSMKSNIEQGKKQIDSAEKEILELEKL